MMDPLQREVLDRLTCALGHLTTLRLRLLESDERDLVPGLEEMRDLVCDWCLDTLSELGRREAQRTGVVYLDDRRKGTVRK